jgi:hypothetical protein
LASQVQLFHCQPQRSTIRIISQWIKHNQTNTCRFPCHFSEAIAAYWNSVRHTQWFQEHPVLSSSDSLIGAEIFWWWLCCLNWSPLSSMLFWIF